MYLTTSRKPSPETKRLCEALASLVPFCVFENRGKKGIEDVIAQCRMLGKSRVCFVYEAKGNPSRIAFAKVSHKGWDWMLPEIAILGNCKLKLKGGKQPAALEFQGSHAGAMKELLSPLSGEGAEHEDTVVLVAEDERISFMKMGKEAYWMRVSYEMTHRE